MTAISTQISRENGVSTQYGPHFYTQTTYVGSTSNGISADSVFQSLRLFAAPANPSAWGTAVEQSSTTPVFILGPVFIL
jgi:hypothetical protein